MPSINFATREISCKIVYYGPGLSGKTTNLEVVHKRAPKDRKGPLTNIATEGDRTLFFDYMPLTLGKVNGMTTRFQLYTVPGQQYYNATRRLVLRGADGVVFVADSQASMTGENEASFADLEENLREQGLELKDLPHVIQWNKRDLPSALPVEQLDARLNRYGAPTIEATAVTAAGVFPTLRKVAHLVLEDLSRKFMVNNGKTKEEATPPRTGRGDAPEDGEPGAARRGPARPEATGEAPPTATPTRVAPDETPSGPKLPPARVGPSRTRTSPPVAPEVEVVASLPPGSPRRAWLLLFLLIALAAWAATGPGRAWLTALLELAR